MSSQLQARVERDIAGCNRKKRENVEQLEARNTQLEARNTQLEDVVKKAHSILLHEMDNGRTPVMLQGVGLGYFEDVIAGIER